MRYQLFRRGLRNKRCLATLDSSPACDIPEATEWLMFKDMHRPIEEDDEFVGDVKAPSAVASNQAAIDALSLKMDAILLAQSQQQTQNGFYQPRSPRNRSPRVDAVVNSSVPASGNGFTGSSGLPFRGIRMGADQRTHDGVSVCGMCHLLGCSREACRRQRMKCRRCGMSGHIAVECEQSDGQGFRGGSGCYFCHEQGHGISSCPQIAGLREMANQAKAGQQ
ncbi:hypothetical protein PHMEG_00018805 [Phytophthora megakarya]|uniref:CCHC-type domain-containing protein n=1 Tax=Phytophthora megakarya TaxID=4795 RepID=A0A225VT45_9STRA|nr:hypothetical protein PHMEG_00018805 [Phytophthora megakarya]